MKILHCVTCNKKHGSAWGWTHRKWHTDRGVIDGWGHNNHPTKHYEFTTDSIREDRRKYEKELLQPFREGQVSKEYLDAYPAAKKGMIKEGIITKKQAKEAKNV